MNATVLLNTEQVRLNSDNRKRIYFILLILFLLTAIGVVFLIYSKFNYFYTPIIAGVCMLLLFMVFRNVSASLIATGYIKNRAIILKLLSEKSYVLETNYIKKIHSSSFLGISITTIKFKFDGIKKRVLLFGRPEVGESIEKVVTVLKNELKKANHKSGSGHADN
ncbi:MAG TPA: hypothetical protein PLI97_06845 [Fluviicola sp.]|nr:hypothetical protein [Fluviicola sp.]